MSLRGVPSHDAEGDVDARKRRDDSYRRNIERHVVPALGAVPLDKLTVEDLDLFYARLLTSGRLNSDRGSAGLSPKTVRNIHLMLNKAQRMPIGREPSCATSPRSPTPPH